MKRSTASATATRKTTDIDAKNRWFRLAARPDLTEIDNLLDLYWGGPERRITGITVRIIGVNTIALIILMLGILYLGQYQNTIVKAHLETFQSELELIVNAVAEAGSENFVLEPAGFENLKPLVAKLSKSSNQRISVFDYRGMRVIDSDKLAGAHPAGAPDPKSNYASIQMLKKMAAFVLKFTPDREIFPKYPNITSDNAQDYQDARDALKGEISLSVWQGTDSKIFLTAAAPLYKNGALIGSLLLERPGHDIEQDIAKVWLNVLFVFALTLILTILLSIYLSGVIARPLKKLAQAAEAVRKGQATAQDIPDFSNRHDEIGELSFALRQMTGALWERMDSIEQFAADVSHELKNPLTSLRSAVETASIVKKDADREKLLGIIRNDVDRLDRLITDISNASRLDAELSRESFEKIDLKDLLAHLLETYQNPLERAQKTSRDWSLNVENNGITLSLNCADKENVFVLGVQQRIGQVFQNLLANALSFSPAGGNISIFVIPLKRRVSITIEDQGPGIPESKLETIFERFYSERPDHEDFGLHSGLGLSICKHIIETHGGRIFAENVKDPRGTITGARFTVILNKA